MEEKITKVTVETVSIYTSPDAHAKCTAHGQSLCIDCARNPGSCDPDHDGSPDCGYYAETGMHWDTCPNRIR